MDFSRSSVIAASLLAHEALALVSAHHPRGLASFAVDAYVAKGELEIALTCSAHAVRAAYALAFPWKGCVPDSHLLGHYRALHTAHVAMWPIANAADQRLSTFTRCMDEVEHAELESAVIRFWYNKVREAQHKDSPWSFVNVDC